MSARILIDSTQPEETRVVVHSNNRIEDYDYETASRKQLKGNIYLAKVTRVEPSLQAAFVEYGGNRHGFLPFSEIHPDYYRIPIADREALMAEEAAADSDGDDGGDDGGDDENGVEDNDPVEAAADAEGDSAPDGDENGDAPKAKAAETPGDNGDNGDSDVPEVREIETKSKVDQVGGDDFEEAAKRRVNLMRRYKIQEVIKRRQIILIQVSKEERGNKGAALTTYLSLAGRYCVLMPNTNKGGGISRKISNPNDRRRLKSILSDLQIPEGIAVIVRTAGAQRSKIEIKRDYEYLMRLWNEIRETTLQSTAPAVVHEEAQLIKRSVRDLYTRDMDDIVVDGEDGYKAAKSFMKSLMPSHARKVKLFKDDGVSLFQHYKVEEQLDSMHLPTVQLPSGGYIVLNATEALVAIDVNSGKSTRERNIEETALKTNLEAATEIGRQLRLRDLAGLVVIDFIDMEESRHNREVERRMKEALRHDRARIQLGRISHFGLLEMSRQRLRPSLFESSTAMCPHCNGSGFLRTTESVSLQLLRGLEDEAVRGGEGAVTVTLPLEIMLFVINQKRTRLSEIEQRHSLKVDLVTGELRDGSLFSIVRTEGGAVEESDGDRNADRKRGRRRRGRRPEEEDTRRGSSRSSSREENPVETVDDPEDDEPVSPEDLEDETGTAEAAGTAESQDEDGDDKPRKRRRRGKRGGRRRRQAKDTDDLQDGQPQDGQSEGAPSEDGPSEDGQLEDGPSEDGPSEDAQHLGSESETETKERELPQDAGSSGEASGDLGSASGQEAVVDEPAPRKRRSRSRKAVEAAASDAAVAKPAEAQETTPAAATPDAPGPDAPVAEEKPKRARRPRRTAKKTAEAKPQEADEAVADEAPAATPARKPATRRRKAAAPSTPKPLDEAPAPEQAAETSPSDADGAAAAPSSARPDDNEEPPLAAAAVDGPASSVTEPPTAQSAAADSTLAEPDDDQPKRQGWWNRIIGS